MNFYVGITDQAWFNTLSSLTPSPDEVNFWQPSGKSTFRALHPGELFLFKLHIEVSRRIREEFKNGRYYFTFHGQQINLPQRPLDQPSAEFLTWHNENKYRG